jgi:hypothetical protein
MIETILLFIIGLICGYRIGLEKALKDPHYAEGFIEGFDLRALRNFIRRKQ